MVRNVGKCQFSDNSRPGCWLGLGSEPHVVGRLGSGPPVGAGALGGIFSRGVVSGGVVSRGLSPIIYSKSEVW